MEQKEILTKAQEITAKAYKELYCLMAQEQAFDFPLKTRRAFEQITGDLLTMSQQIPDFKVTEKVLELEESND